MGAIGECDQFMPFLLRGSRTSMHHAHYCTYIYPSFAVRISSFLFWYSSFRFPSLPSTQKMGQNDDTTIGMQKSQGQPTTSTFGRLSFACKGKPSKSFESSIWHIDLAANLGPGNLVETSCHETPISTDTALMVQPEIRRENLLRLVGLSVYPIIYKVLAPSQVVIAEFFHQQ